MMEKLFPPASRFFSRHLEEQFRLTSGYFSIVERNIDWTHGESAGTAGFQIIFLIKAKSRWLNDKAK
jgi:hypothetical protein